MLQRVMLIGLLGISMVAMLRAEASAGCTCTKIIGGSCFTCCNGSCFWAPKGLLCALSGRATGGGGKALACGGEGVCPGVSDTDGICKSEGGEDIPREDVTLKLACQNNGGNFSVGNNPQTVSTALTGVTGLDAQVRRGKFKNATVVAQPTDMQALNPLCGPPVGGQTWTAYDVALCGIFEAVAEVQSEGELDGQVRVLCAGNCADIDFVVSQGQGQFTGPPYQCYLCPLTPDGLHWDCAACVQAGLGGAIDCAPTN
jgi:hypothetical protein